MEFCAYDDKYLSSIVDFWNRNFGNRRNFFPVSETIFRYRVIDKANNIEHFDPHGFIVAVDKEDVVGAIHVGIRAEAICKILYPDWKRGTEGYVAFIAVDKDYRKKGIGGELWQRGMKYLDGVSEIIIDGQCINPFYGNSECPFTPFWGTPEGISIDWNDEQTKSFFEKRYYKPRFKAVSLEINEFTKMGAKMWTDTIFSDEVKTLKNIYPHTGMALKDATQYGDQYDFECVTAVKDDKVVSALTYYPMKEVGERKYAVYEFITDAKYQGKGIGKFILAKVLENLKDKGAKTCDVLTIPDLSDNAMKLYQRAGFKPVAEWAIY